MLLKQKHITRYRNLSIQTDYRVKLLLSETYTTGRHDKNTDDITQTKAPFIRYTVSY